MLNFKAFLFGCCQSEANRADDKNIIITEPKKPSQDSSMLGATTVTDRNVTKTPKRASEEVKKEPYLILKAIEGNVIPLDTEIKINPLGLADGGRKKQDGITYIGCQKYILAGKNAEQQLYNDILLNDASVGDQHCMIKYDQTQKKYFLKDLGEGSGTFVKIDQEIPLKPGYIISFGDSHMVATVEAPSRVKQSSDIMLKFLDGPKSDEVYTFKTEDKVIKVGRMSDCEIKFDGNSLSRYQLTIEYKEDKGWVVIDGYNGKQSTNGTWLYVEGLHEITNNMTVKIGQTLFKLTLAMEDG